MPEIERQRDDGANHLRAFRIDAHAADERPIDLDGVCLESVEIAER